MADMQQLSVTAPSIQQGAKKMNLARRETIAAYLFISPWIIGFVVFLIIPIVMSLYASFTRWTLIGPPPLWVGFENFERIFTRDRYFWPSLRITAEFILLTLPASLVLGLSLALLLNQKLRGIRLFRTIFYVPAVVSGVAVAILWLNLLNSDVGAINQVLRALGIADPPNWLQSSQWVRPAVAIMSLWGVGGSAVIYLAGLQNIPVHLYEAAEIDGASPWQSFWKITLPLISPTLFFMLITGLIASFQVFTPAIILGNGTGGFFSPSSELRFFLVHIYTVAFREGKLGMASALAWIFIILSGIVTFVVFFFSEKWVYYEETGGGK
jgi:ABC-type sugar transport system permease subunit